MATAGAHLQVHLQAGPRPSTPGLELKETTMKARISNDIKTAMKSGDKAKTGTLRLINAAIQIRRDRKQSNAR